MFIKFEPASSTNWAFSLTVTELSPSITMFAPLRMRTEALGRPPELVSKLILPLISILPADRLPIAIDENVPPDPLN